jgi:hypothetical protein
LGYGRCDRDREINEWLGLNAVLVLSYFGPKAQPKLRALYKHVYIIFLTLSMYQKAIFIRNNYTY